MIDGVFSKFLHRYAARFPNVQIKLSEAVGHDMFARLERGELHLAIGFLQAIQAESHEFEFRCCRSSFLPPVMHRFGWGPPGNC